MKSTTCRPTSAARVVSIGNFDGVHLGHAHVLREARATADRLGIETVVAVTFDPHPMAVLRPEHAPPTLTSIETRARLLEAAGVDAILVRRLRPPGRGLDAGGVHRPDPRRDPARRCRRASAPTSASAPGPPARWPRSSRPARPAASRPSVCARRRPAGVELDLRPPVPGHRRRRRRGRGARPAVHRPRHGRRGRQAGPRDRLPDRQRARSRRSTPHLPTACTPAG